MLQGGLGRLFVGISAFELGNCAATLMILRATDLLEPGHGIDDATTIAIALYVAYNVSATVTSVAAGHASDRRTPRLVLAVGAAAFAVAYIGFTRDTTSWLALAPWFVLAGVGMAPLRPPNSRRRPRRTARHPWSAFGLLAAVQSSATSPPAIAVWWTALSPSSAFVFLAAAIFLATSLISRNSADGNPAGGSGRF